SHTTDHLLLTMYIVLSICHQSLTFTLFPYTTLFRSLRKTRNQCLPDFLEVIYGRQLRTVQSILLCSNFPELFRGFQTSVYFPVRSEEHTSELQSRFDIVCRLLLEQ